MIARLLISGSTQGLVAEIRKLLMENGLPPNHPDLLYFPEGAKLGIAEARKIKEHFSLKPYSAKGRAVVMEDASALTVEAQNALLKTLEEPPSEAILILGGPSDVKFLPTILSRCEIIRLKISDDTLVYHSKYAQDLDKLINSSIEERFEYVEKLKERKEFLHAMVAYFRNNLASHMSTHSTSLSVDPESTEGSSGNVNFIKELLTAEEWAAQNVNIRAILEYLMLVMPNH